MISARNSWTACLGVARVEFVGGGDQLVEIRQTILALVSRLGREVLAVSGAAQSSLRMPCSAEPSRRAESSSIKRANSSSARPALSRRAVTRGGLPRHFQQGNLTLARRRDQVLERGLAEAARGNVDDAHEGEVVLGIDEQAQVGERRP